MNHRKVFELLFNVVFFMYFRCPQLRGSGNTTHVEEKHMGIKVSKV